MPATQTTTTLAEPKQVDTPHGSIFVLRFRDGRLYWRTVAGKTASQPSDWRGPFDSEQDIIVQATRLMAPPSISRADYAKIHEDFKGTIDGKPYMMYLDLHGTTVSGAVQFID